MGEHFHIAVLYLLRLKKVKNICGDDDKTVFAWGAS